MPLSRGGSCDLSGDELFDTCFDLSLPALRSVAEGSTRLAEVVGDFVEGRNVGDSSSSEPDASSEMNAPSADFLCGWNRGLGRRKMLLRWRGASSDDEDEEDSAGEDGLDARSGAMGRDVVSILRGAVTLAVRKLL